MSGNDNEMMDSVFKLLNKLKLLKRHQNENKDLIKKLEKRLGAIEELLLNSKTSKQVTTSYQYNSKIIHNLKLKIIILSSYVILDIASFFLTKKRVLDFIILLFK